MEELEALNGVLGALEETVNGNSDEKLASLAYPLLRCGNSCQEFTRLKNGGWGNSAHASGMLKHSKTSPDMYLHSYKLTLVKFNYHVKLVTNPPSLLVQAAYRKESPTTDCRNAKITS